MRSLCYEDQFSFKLKLELITELHRTNYHNKNSALRLALKERLMGTRKWPILSNHERCACGTKRLIPQVQSKFGQKKMSVRQH